ncbi:Hypothetical protein PHPALM_6102 [Phytophthora palmivora]|uniref:Uncharacterized protein n=1 Tax=Phytophthora palmivora TaxID=4796 RepID=A0A2P4YFN2_9STRA|nr:Hypothetical protein PHPALM_6102 [Phytophthora palmivora]
MDLQLQDDEMATVEEILAFVDSIEWDGNDIVDEGETVEPQVKDVTSPDPQMSIQSTIKAPKRKRIRTGWSSSTGLQRRKRAELEFLRAHVKELEAYLEQLKDRDSGTQIAALAMDHTSVDWQEVALEEFIERKKSEEANRILKTIVDNHVLVGQTLRQVVHERVIL